MNGHAVGLGLAIALSAGCGGASSGSRSTRATRGARAPSIPVRVVARIDGVAQCPSPLTGGEWLVTRVARSAAAVRMSADGATGEPIQGLGERSSGDAQGALAYCAVPSPDGRRVAYTVTSPEGWYEVEVRGVDGGQPTRLGAGVSPAWSPDGQRIAYLTFGEDEPPAIVLADARRGARVSQIAAPTRTVLVSPPAFSPDGAQIAFSAGPTEGASEFDLYVAQASGGTPRRLTRGGAWNLSPAWTSDGRHLVFVSKGAAGSDVWAVPVGGGALVPLIQTPDDESDPRPWGAGLRWVAALAGTSDVYLYDLGTPTEPRVVAETPTEERAGAVTEGHDVVVVRWTDSDSDLWVQPLEGGDPWALVSGDTRDGWPGVDPAGTVVAFLRSTGDAADVWLTSIERGRPRALTQGAKVRDGSAPRVSPDGTRVAYVVLGSGDEEDTLVVQSIEGGQLVRLVAEPETYAWDPSGATLVVAAYERDEPRLLRVRADGRGRKERLEGNLEGLALLSVLPGGTDALALDEAEAPRLLRVNLRTGRRTVELTLPGNVDPASVSVATDPDGEHVVVAQNLIRSEVREVADLSSLIAAAERSD